MRLGLYAERAYDTTTAGWGGWEVYSEPAIVFRLEGTAVPEPGTLLLLVLGGLCGLAAGRWQRRRVG